MIGSEGSGEGMEEGDQASTRVSLPMSPSLPGEALRGPGRCDPFDGFPRDMTSLLRRASWSANGPKLGSLGSHSGMGRIEGQIGVTIGECEGRIPNDDDKYIETAFVAT
jgi:hypothetical protein